MIAQCGNCVNLLAPFFSSEKLREINVYLETVFTKYFSCEKKKILFSTLCLLRKQIIIIIMMYIYHKEKAFSREIIRVCIATYPSLYRFSSSNKYPKEDTAAGSSTSLFGFGGSSFTRGFLYTYPVR